MHTLQCHRWISSHSSAALSPVSSSSSGVFTDWQSLLCLQGLTLKAGCDWWQVPAARAASPSHQLCTGLKFTHRLTQYSLRSSRLHACCIYQKNIHVWVSWTQRRNSETASCCCWKRAEPGCLLLGQFLWEGTLAGFQQSQHEGVWERLLLHTDFWSYSLQFRSAFRLINYCGKRRKKMFGHT